METTTKIDLNTASPELLKQALIKIEKDEKNYMNKLADLEQERSEYRLVLEALEETPSDRRCFRMMGGVLIEHTVEEVKPALRQHKEWIDQAIQNMSSETDKLRVNYSKLATRYEEIFKEKMTEENAPKT